MNILISLRFLLLALLPSHLLAQSLTSSFQQSAQVPAGSIPVFVDLNVDPAVTGDFIDVLTADPSVKISILLPNGTEVNAANASRSGFEWHVMAGPNQGFTIFDIPGTHTIIKLPNGAAAGLYQIKAVSLVAAEMGVLYISLSSSLKAGLMTKELVHRTGQPVVLNAFVFRDTTPVTGAIPALSIVARTDISSQASIGNYRLIDTTEIDADTSRYEYAADLTNKSATPLTRVIATLDSLSTDTTVFNGALGFNTVPGSGSSPSLNSFSVDRKNSLPFNPSVLRWKIESWGDAVSVPMADGGASDAKVGDGIYTGTFIPLSPGEYMATVTIVGTSSGTRYARTAATSFEVTSTSATFSSFQDQATDDDGNGFADRLAVTANVNVTTAARYAFYLVLRASNGKTLTASQLANLSAGSQKITVSFAAKAILKSLGVNGPYQRERATLVRIDKSEDIPADGREDAGATAAYSLSAFDRGPIYFTGRNSAAGISRSGNPPYDTLRVRAGVHSKGIQSCYWNAILTDKAGNPLDVFTGTATLPAGGSAINFDFRGPKIAVSGKNGPYLVKESAVTCEHETALQPLLMQTQVFLASQFATGSRHFTLSRTPAPPEALTVQKGSFDSATIALDTTGAYTGFATLSMGTSAGNDSLGAADATVQFEPPQPVIPSPARMIVKIPLTSRLLPNRSYRIGIKATPLDGSAPRETSILLKVTNPSGYTVGAVPYGASFSVDGKEYLGDENFPWLPGTTHSLRAPSPQVDSGHRYTFQNWSDGQPAQHQITASSTRTIFVANFLAEYAVKISASPANGGRVRPSGEAFYAAGSNVSVSAVASPGYQFQSWIGTDSNPSSASTTVRVLEPTRLTAEFVPLPTSLSIALPDKRGPLAARTWAIAITNSGPGAAYDTELSVTLGQQSGTACKPRLIGRLPLSAGELAPGAVKTVSPIFNFASCPPDATFGVTIRATANNGVVNQLFTLDAQQH